MGIARLLSLPLAAAAILTSEKSFSGNPVIGSARLNRLGLHRARVRTAAAIASARRRSLTKRVSPDDRAFFDAHGYLKVENLLDPVAFEALRDEVFGTHHVGYELDQGETTNRFVPISRGTAAHRPAAFAFAQRPDVRARIEYAAGRRGEPVMFIQTVFATPERDDPQTVVHADTFHSSAKAWFFLERVGPDDGPFVYVPGSHRLTPERLAWEHERSLTARDDPRPDHADGSFRIDVGTLAALGLPPPLPLPVEPNTLVVADTFGFHARAPSRKPNRRVAIYGYLRRNPFVPVDGQDLFRLPGLRGRELDAFLALLELRARLGQTRRQYRPTPPVSVTDPPHT